MWASTKRTIEDYRGTIAELREECAHAQGERVALERMVTSLQTTMDWMRVRVTQLEHERAVLMKTYLGVTVAVPNIIPAPDPTENKSYLETPTFDGLNDQVAAALGIGWNEDGTLKYSTPQR